MDAQLKDRQWVKLDIPMIGGSTPTAYSVPIAREEDGFKDADAVFMGIQWGAPLTPEFLYTGYGANYGVTRESPAAFRSMSLRHRGGYLPELGVSVFDHVRLVDSGDIPGTDDMELLLNRVEGRARAIRQAGAAVISYGGNAGPSSYAVVAGIADEEPGSVAIVNFDAHADNRPGDWRREDPAFSTWGSSWVNQLLRHPNVDASRFHHVGLRGPVNDRGVYDRFGELGVERDRIVGAGELKRARREGFEQWVEEWAKACVADSPAVWVAVDIDVLDMGSNPDYADEPFGPSADEIIEMIGAVTRAAGRERFAGLSFMAIPPGAQKLHVIASYILLHALAGVADGANG